jgi:aerobic-type carbon monoxide dehydrogenase small subunit (CoxS/CutS family)
MEIQCQRGALPGTPLIYVLCNDLKLKGTRFGCGAGVCGCCCCWTGATSNPAPPVSVVEGREVSTIEGLGGNTKRDCLVNPLVDRRL